MIYCMVGGTGFFIDILGRCYLSVLREAPSLGMGTLLCCAQTSPTSPTQAKVL